MIHIRADLVEALRVTGNIVAIAAALIVLLGVAKAIAPQILGGAAAAVFILSVLHSFQHGWGIAMLAFVGLTILLLLLLAQTAAKRTLSQSGDGEAKYYPSSTVFCPPRGGEAHWLVRVGKLFLWI